MPNTNVIIMAAPAVRFISQSISHEKEAQIVLNKQMSHLIALTGLKVTSWIFAKLNTPFDTFYNNINLAHHISLEFSSFESLTESVHNQLTLHIDLLLFFFFLFFFSGRKKNFIPRPHPNRRGHSTIPLRSMRYHSCPCPCRYLELCFLKKLI